MAKTVEDKFKVGDWIFLPYEKDESKKYLKLDKSNIDYYNNQETQIILVPQMVRESHVRQYYEEMLAKHKNNVFCSNMAIGIYEYKLKNYFPKN